MNTLDLSLYRAMPDDFALALEGLLRIGAFYDVVLLHPMTHDALAMVAPQEGARFGRLYLRPDGDAVVGGVRFKRAEVTS